MFIKDINVLFYLGKKEKKFKAMSKHFFRLRYSHRFACGLPMLSLLINLWIRRDFKTNIGCSKASLKIF